MSDPPPPDPHPERPSLDPFLAALGEYWSQVLDLADDDQKALLWRLALGLELDDPTDTLAALADEMLVLLPGDHPVVGALHGGVMYGAGISARDLAHSFRRLRDRIGPGPVSLSLPPAAGSGEPPYPPGELDDFDREVRQNLRALAWLSPAEVQDLDIDPRQAGLIRLPADGEGPVQLPRFQFEGGQPRPVVLEVNELLDAATDPWGVACWWVYPHARLNQAPADLLGSADQRLLRAAVAVLEA